MAGRVLVPLDGSDLSLHALQYAVRVASAAHSALVLLHVREPVAARKRPPYNLTPLASRLRSEGLEVETLAPLAHRDETADVICETARDPGTGLIVMATHGRGGLGRWIYGSVADQVLRNAEIPVLMCPTATDHAWPTDRRLRILVPLDGSKMAEEVVEPAGQLASVLGADILVMRAITPDLRPRFGGQNVIMPDLPRVDDDALREYLWAVAARLEAPGRTVDIRPRLGSPAAMIARTVHADDVDLIAMTTRAHGGFSRWSLGSVALDTLRRAHLPLFLVRPPSLAHVDALSRTPIDQMLAPPPPAPAEAGIGIALSAEQQLLVSEALELFMNSVQGQTAVIKEVREILEKLRAAQPTSAG